MMRGETEDFTSLTLLSSDVVCLPDLSDSRLVVRTDPS
jgi:hypothetical protein